MIGEDNDLNKDNEVVKEILRHPTYKTNKIIVNLNEEDTKKILANGEVKLGLPVHKVEKSYQIITCDNCLGYGHFHKSKDKLEIMCDKEARCSHCSENHNLKDCPIKQDKSKAKCVHFKGNYRS